MTFSVLILTLKSLITSSPYPNNISYQQQMTIMSLTWLFLQCLMWLNPPALDKYRRSTAVPVIAACNAVSDGWCVRRWKESAFTTRALSQYPAANYLQLQDIRDAYVWTMHVQLLNLTFLHRRSWSRECNAAFQSYQPTQATFINLTESENITIYTVCVCVWIYSAAVKHIMFPICKAAMPTLTNDSYFDLMNRAVSASIACYLMS